MCIAAGLVGGEAFSVDASLIKADVDKKKRMSGDRPIAWPKVEEASRAVREYLAALDAARNDEGSVDRDGGGSSGGGSRSKPPKEVSLTDPQAAWVARPGMDPFFAYDVNYLIDNKLGIILDAEGTRANRIAEIAVIRRWWSASAAASIFGPRGSQATLFMARSGCSSGWWIVRSPRTFRCGTSRRALTVPSVEPICLRPGAQCLYLPRWRGADQYRQHRSGPHRLLQGYQERLLDLLAEAQVHDGGCAQDHPRP